MSGAPFPETPRVDALDKVRGKPIFGADDASAFAAARGPRRLDYRKGAHHQSRHQGSRGRAGR